MPPVSAELRRIAETAFDALNSGDLDGYLSVIAEDVEFTSMIAEVEGVTFRGHDGAREWWETVRGSFQDLRWELLELRECDPGAVANIRASGSLGGLDVDQTVWQAATFRDGKLTWWAFFRTEDEAREALRAPA
jgi:ketosteroid isomerase-like protein